MSLTEEENIKKPSYRKFLTWLAIFTIISSFTFIYDKDKKNNNTQENTQHSVQENKDESKTLEKIIESVKKEKLTLEEGWTIDKSNGYSAYIEGYVKNNTNEPIDNYIQITFDALDKDGANLGTCFDNTNTIDANGKWKFKAICFDSKNIETVRLKKITGF